jgi:hypothetical protein
VGENHSPHNYLANLEFSQLRLSNAVHDTEFCEASRLRNRFGVDCCRTGIGFAAVHLSGGTVLLLEKPLLCRKSVVPDSFRANRTD